MSVVFPCKSVAFATLLGTAMFSLAPPAHSAEIKPGDTSACQLKLDGPIQAGDAQKFDAALAALPADNGAGVKLCLNSPGGNYDEALKIISIVLKHSNVATVVDRNAQCYSACAFLFLSGNSQASEDGELAPDRTLDVSATLGFHAPYLKGAASTGTGTDVAQATIENFRHGVTAIAKMLEIDRRELFPRGLLAKALQVTPDQLLYVDTIEKAGVWSLKLKGFAAPKALTDRMLDQACRNKDMWTNYSHTFLARPANDPDELHGYRESDFPEIRGTGQPIQLTGGKYRTVLDLFGYEATNICVIDVYHAKQGLFLSLTMVPAEQPGPDPAQFAQDVDARLNDPLSLAGIATPLWYVYPPETTLKSIAQP
jgi:hypothetical protein